MPPSLEGVERYLEVHIEQGRVLEEGAEDIGVVEAIAGMLQATLEIEGRADHAGATPMHLRSNEGLTAAEVIVELERVAREAGGSAVGTVGRVELYPGNYAERRRAQRGDHGPRRILADFVIGAHALRYASALLTLDQGVYRAAFPELEVLTPE